MAICGNVITRGPFSELSQMVICENDERSPVKLVCVAGIGVVDPIENWSLMLAPRALFTPRRSVPRRPGSGVV